MCVCACVFACVYAVQNKLFQDKKKNNNSNNNMVVLLCNSTWNVVIQRTKLMRDDHSKGMHMNT